MSSERDGGPTVSVIVPVYNDPEGIDRTLSALTDQTVADAEYEVLAVDNGSTDRTKDVIREYRQRNPGLVTLGVEDDIQGSYAARNAGIERATGEVIAFVDADMTVDRRWLASVREAMADADYAGFDVQIEGTVEDGPVVAYNHVREFPVERYLENGDFAPTCCLAVRRSVFELVGTFDASLESSGDAEFGRRVADAGFDQVFVPSVTMYHPPRSAAGLVRKYVRIGRGLHQRRRDHPERFDDEETGVGLADVLPTVSPRQLVASARDVQARAGSTLSLRTLGVFYVLEQLVRLSTLVGRLAARLERDHPAGDRSTDE
ncbi:glycosyltransferase [Halobaculum rarum]|uniref:glycosyltransferase n=1 Tax=Halobaculum rarum TaxID=3075122 RepID=UPI0032AF97E5